MVLLLHSGRSYGAEICVILFLLRCRFIWHDAGKNRVEVVKWCFFLSQDSEEDLQSMAFGMKSFVDKVSSHEGAEFPWYVGQPRQHMQPWYPVTFELMPPRSAEDVTGIELNPDTFMESMQAMLGTDTGYYFMLASRKVILVWEANMK